MIYCFYIFLRKRSPAVGNTDYVWPVIDSGEIGWNGWDSISVKDSYGPPWLSYGSYAYFVNSAGTFGYNNGVGVSYGL